MRLRPGSRAPDLSQGAAVTGRPAHAEICALLDGAERVQPGRRPPGARRCLGVERGQRWIKHLAQRLAPSVLIGFAVLGTVAFWGTILVATCQ